MNIKNKNLSLKKGFFKGICASALIATMAIGGFSIIQNNNTNSVNANITHSIVLTGATTDFSNLQTEYNNACEALLTQEYYDKLGNANIKIADYNLAKDNFYAKVIADSLDWNNYKNAEAETRLELLTNQQVALDTYNIRSEELLKFTTCTNANKFEVENAIFNYNKAITKLRELYVAGTVDNVINENAELRLSKLTQEKNALKSVVNRPGVVEDKKTYIRGQKQGISFLGFDSSKMKFVGEYEFENACQNTNKPYIVKIALIEPTLYEWDNGNSDTLEFEFVIEKAQLFAESDKTDFTRFPKIENRTFVKNGDIFSLECPMTDYMKKYHIEANGQANNHQKEAGVYEVKFYFNITENAENYLQITDYRTGIMIIKDRNLNSNNGVLDINLYNKTGFHPEASIIPKKLDKNTLTETFITELSRGMKENEEIFDIYNFQYSELDENNVLSDYPLNKINIRIKLPQNLQGKDFKIVHYYNDDIFTNANRYLLANDNTQIDENKYYYTMNDGFVEIKDIQHLDTFAFVGIEKEPFPVWAIILIVLGGILGLALLTFITLLILWKAGCNLGKLNNSFDKMLGKKGVKVEENNDAEFIESGLSELDDSITENLDTEKPETSEEKKSKKSSSKKEKSTETKTKTSDKKTTKKPTTKKSATTKTAQKKTSTQKTTAKKSTAKKTTSKSSSTKKSTTKKSTTTKKTTK